MSNPRRIVPGTTYLVGESGPELLTMGSQGGRITPNDRLTGAGGGKTVEIAPGTTAVVPVIALVPASRFVHGEHPVTVHVHDDAGYRRELPATLMGPER